MPGTNPSTFCVACRSKENPVDLGQNFECRKCNGSMHHECWTEYGKDLCPGCLKRKEIVKILSGAHKGKSTDEETLCAATFQDLIYDPNSLEELRELQTLQSELLMACSRAGEPWVQ